ncbi:hypothetical protein [Pedobacter frigiditerrae]|uniref:hypothetical protein n=1 Tax=Pedobacter frigiditerrae TaxID=2530452 RepID=UPI0029310B98|nr:hypothetical protein [Pedobacter frigiditerrae]
MKKTSLKSLLFLILLACISFVGTAQTVIWNPVIYGPSSGTYSVSSNSTTYTYDSDLLYAKFSLDTNGHTIHYDILVKYISINTGGMKGEFQSTIGQDTGPGTIYATQFLAWNDPTSPYYCPYPTGSTYSYSGSCEIGTEETAYWMHASVMFWNEDDYIEWSDILLYPQITR